MIRHVAIVGGGFSGSLLAINLLRHDGPRATLVERRAAAGVGLAFGAAHPDHLLNVRAGNMSALPDDPGHFVRWLEDRGIGDAAGRFVPRLLYGRYLQDLLEAARAREPRRLEIVAGEVRAIGRDGRLRLAAGPGGESGAAIDADAAVLAIGNLPPHAPPPLDPAALGALYRGDPWEPGLAAGLADDGIVLVLGTGLTMVDVALSLAAQGYRGRILALSRRGLLPRVHTPVPARPIDAPVPAPAPIAERPPAQAVALLRFVRGLAAGHDWRGAVDALRPITQDLWRAADPHERRRFLRHLRAWWDVHRHRLAPAVADRIAGLQAEGRLEIAAGRLVAAAAAGDRAMIRWRPRGSTAEAALTVDRIVNCTGPQGDLARTDDPLLAALVGDGLVRPDALAIGIDVDRQGRVIAADGRASPGLFAIGPMTRGAFWEIVAVPDIRVQSWDLARRLSHAQWVGGEGL